MLAGLALELGLKLFFMSYFKDGPPRTHLLSQLFNELPAQIRDDIAETYATGEAQNSDIKVYAFMNSPTPPAKPEGVHRKNYHDAAAVFDSASDSFVRSRYFFEMIDGSGWSVVDHPIDYMLGMSRVLELVYQTYAKYGGWGDQVPKSS